MRKLLIVALASLVLLPVVAAVATGHQGTQVAHQRSGYMDPSQPQFAPALLAPVPTANFNDALTPTPVPVVSPEMGTGSGSTGSDTQGAGSAAGLAPAVVVTPEITTSSPAGQLGSGDALPAVVATPEARAGSGGPSDPSLLLDGSGASKDGLADPFGAPPAPLIDPRRFTEAHWQGLELIPQTAALVTELRIPPELHGVVADDVTMPADLQGFEAGDAILSVGQVPTPSLMDFIRATERVRDRRRTEVEIWRQGARRRMVLTALLARLGTANGETPSMIASGARAPHRYRGACTSCHRIGITGQLANDQGDPTIPSAPAIRGNAFRPHQDYGPCTTCHEIMP